MNITKIMYKRYIPNENLIFPPNLGDLVPEDAPVKFFSDIIDQMDLSSLHSIYSASTDGQPPYHPVMMFKVILFGYMNNIFSTRELETVMKRDAHYIWLSSYNFPDHTTINRFKTRCIPFIKDIFAQLVTVLVRRGEITLAEDLYIDGTTIRSRAARRRIRWRKSSEKFSALADRKVQEAINEMYGQMDQGMESDEAGAEHVSYTVDEAREIVNQMEHEARKKGVPGVRGRMARIRKAIDRKETHDETVRQCEGRCGVAPADPECGVMHAKEDGYDSHATPNYNVQIATNNQYVTNYDVFPNPDDYTTNLDFIDTVIKENGIKPQTVVEDAGYGYEDVYVGLRKRDIDAVVKYPGYDRSGNQEVSLRLSPDGSTLYCPQGILLKVVGTEEAYFKSGYRSDATYMTCGHCGKCPLAGKCPVARAKDHTIKRKLGYVRECEIAKANLDKPHNQAKLRRRSLEPEPVFGQLKHNHGYTKFRHFGKSKVRMDLGLELMALNIMKLFRKAKKSV